MYISKVKITYYQRFYILRSSIFQYHISVINSVFWGLRLWVSPFAILLVLGSLLLLWRGWFWPANKRSREQLDMWPCLFWLFIMVVVISDEGECWSTVKACRWWHYNKWWYIWLPWIQSSSSNNNPPPASMKQHTCIPWVDRGPPSGRTPTVKKVIHNQA